MKMFTKLNFEENFNYEYIYPTTHDAILHICYRNNTVTSSKSSPIYQKRYLPVHSDRTQLIKPNDEDEDNEVQPNQVEFVDEITKRF